MARIRSIRPEFWKSESIACYDFFTRLTFIGLWSYVDDNGVGIDNWRLIAAELYPLEEDFASVSREVRECLARLAEGGRIRRYTVDGKRYIAVVNWREHQKIDRPGKARYPEPDDPNATPTPPPTSGNSPSRPPVRETLDEPSRESRETPSTGEGEKGRRGEGEKVLPPSAPLRAERGALALVAAPEPPAERTEPPTTTQALIAEWIDHCRKRPPGNVIGQVSKQIKTMLAEGTDPADVRRGFAEWARKGLHPSTLPSVVNEVMNAGIGTPASGTPSTADQRFGAAMALAAKFAQEEAS